MLVTQRNLLWLVDVGQSLPLALPLSNSKIPCSHISALQSELSHGSQGRKQTPHDDSTVSFLMVISGLRQSSNCKVNSKFAYCLKCTQGIIYSFANFLS
jgi:hypothetical protein